MRLSSFGKSGLICRWTKKASIRRILRAYWAARDRWSNGRLRVRRGVEARFLIQYELPNGVVGLMLAV